MRTVYRRCVVHTRADPPPTAIVVDGDRIDWLGREPDLDDLDGAADADDVVDLQGALVTPGFVDAHAHVLETALAAASTDLSGARSLGEALDLVARTARAPAGGGPVLAHGWDETAWPEARPPSAAELDRAVGGARAYLARVDLHSAVVSTALAEQAGCRDAEGWSDGVVSGAAHELARTGVRAVAAARREELYRVGLAEFARRGVVSVHEHSVGALDSREGLALLLRLTADAASGLPEVVGYLAELCETASDARRLAEEVPGLTGVGGDLTVDGSVGSRSAALRAPYADAPDHAGVLRLSAEEVANHVGAATRAHLQAAFHVIGDRAMAEVLLGFQAAAEVEGIAAVRSGGHRLEHAEMLDTPALARVLLLGLTVSGQPAFDATWGGPDGMYARRLGRVRAGNLNPFADLVAAGVPLAFGSDSPVTPVDPWGAVRAAVRHHDPGQRLTPLAAFRAHTTGGRHAAGGAETGELRVGGPATFAAWHADGPAASGGGTEAAASTGAARGGLLLPALPADGRLPACVLALRDGVVLHRETV